MADSTALVWFRRDLRCNGPPALYAAAHSGLPVVGVYIWEKGDTKEPRRAAFVSQYLTASFLSAPVFAWLNLGLAESLPKQSLRLPAWPGLVYLAAMTVVYLLWS